MEFLRRIVLTTLFNQSEKFGHQNFVGALLVSVALSSAIVKSHSTSVMTEDEEDREDDVKGGYHPVHIGDSFSDRRYTITRKLS
jgi:hypothetical protein